MTDKSGWAIDIVCPECGKPFVRSSDHRKYCCDECKKSARTKRNVVYMREYNARNRELLSKKERMRRSARRNDEWRRAIVAKRLMEVGCRV